MRKELGWQRGADDVEAGPAGEQQEEERCNQQTSRDHPSAPVLGEVLLDFYDVSAAGLDSSKLSSDYRANAKKATIPAAMTDAFDLLE